MKWILIVWFWHGTHHAQPIVLDDFESQVNCEYALETFKSKENREFKHQDRDGQCLRIRKRNGR